jgi:transcription elongation factor
VERKLDTRKKKTAIIEAEGEAVTALVGHAVDRVIRGMDGAVEQPITADRSTAMNTEEYSEAKNTGYKSVAMNMGDGSESTNTGEQSVAMNTGYHSVALNAGYRSTAINTGEYSQAKNEGGQSVAMNTGDYSVAEVKGTGSVAASIGTQGRACAAVGCAIVLCYRDENNGRLIHISSSKVGENGVKPDTWYVLDADGTFVEV